VRIGTFEFFANRGDVEGVRTLADYVIARHYPEAASAEEPYRAFFEAVIGRVAALVAKWMQIGFIHGVMNTDNMQIASETIDYGPCAFMDWYDPATVYSSIDANGRYAYGNQPHIAHWNLSRLAGTLLSLLAPEREAAIAVAQAALDTFPAKFGDAYWRGFAAKLGLAEAREGDDALVQDLLDRMTSNRADFTLTFRGLCDAAEGDDYVRAQFADPAVFDEWAVKWRTRTADEEVSAQERRVAMRAVNPAFIPRNHRIQAAIAAAEAGDFSVFDEIMTVLAKPYDDQPRYAVYAVPPNAEEVVHRTFCGT
jgi:uncharacterized protein YdiU (UPF0061 family)